MHSPATRVCLDDLTRSTAKAVSPVSHVLDKAPEPQRWSDKSKSLPLQSTTTNPNPKEASKPGRLPEQSRQPAAHRCLGKPARSTAITVSPASHRKKDQEAAPTPPTQQRGGEGYANPTGRSLCQRATTDSHPISVPKDRFCSALKQQQHCPKMKEPADHRP